MTIHAGEKAARLRRATASSSTSILTSPLSPIHGTSGGRQSSPLSPSMTTPLADTDILGATDSSHIIPRSTSLPSFRSRRSQSNPKSSKQLPSRHRVATNEPACSSSSSLQAITGHFIFSGVDLPHPQTAEVATLDWNKFSAHQAISNETRSYPTTVFFIEQPPKEADADGTMPQDDVETDVPGKDEISLSGGIKTSPRRFLPWIFAFSASPAPPQEAAVIEEQEATTSTADQIGEGGVEIPLKKPTKKKKRKSKGKGKAKAIPNDEGAKVGSSSSLIESSLAATSDELESENAARSSQHQQKARLRAGSGSTARGDDILLHTPSEREEDSTKASEYRRPPSASSSSHSPDNGFISVPARRNTRRNRGKGAKEGQEVCGKEKTKTRALQVHQRSEQEADAIGHARKASKTETETSCHTASLVASLPPSPVPQEKVMPSSEQIADLSADSQTDLEEDKLIDSSISTRTDGSRLHSTEEAKTSTQSSPAESLRVQVLPTESQCADMEGQPELVRLPDSTGIAQHYWPQKNIELTKRNIEPSECEPQGHLVPSYTSASVKIQEETESERLQRTLNWRLLSAGSTSPLSKLAPQLPQSADARAAPKLTVEIPASAQSRRGSQQSGLSATSTASRSQLAFNLRRHQQRRLNFAWVHLLPSFEELHPHRSLERETQLRNLAWLGLEEYLARRVKTTTLTGTKETIAWITHRSPSRNTTLHRSKAAGIEPLLTSSSVWLRAVSKAACNMHYTGARVMEDAVRAYQFNLVQEKSRANNAASPALSGLDHIESNPLEWPVSMLPLAPISPTYAPPASLIFDTASGQQAHIRRPSISTSSNVDQESTLELQRNIENCMHELKSSTSVSPSAGAAWLQTLTSIEQTEKEAMKAFFYNSSLEWRGSLGDGVVGHEGQQVAAEAYPHTELVWPTTPSVHVPAHLGSNSAAKVEEGAIINQEGLSSCEMAEIEDAMFQDYLSQSNQLGGNGPRHSRRKERNMCHGRLATSSQGNRSRAPSSCSHTSMGPSEGQTGSAASFRTRSQEGRQSVAASRHYWDRRPPFQPIPRLNQLSHHPEERFVDNQRESSTPQSFHELQQPTISLHESQTAARSAITEAVSINQHEQYETWAKETENRAVRHSLANLQQHLSLVAAQKQIQGVMSNVEASVPPVETQSLSKLVQHLNLEQSLSAQQRYHSNSTSLSQQLPGGYRDWPLPFDSTLTTSTNGAANVLSHMQRQQQISQEARQLEQRHLDSYARAIEQSALQHSGQIYQGTAGQDQYAEALRLHAAMAGGWTERNAYRDEMYQQAATPTITLTEPYNLHSRSQMTSEEAIRGKMAWSDEPGRYIEEALSHQAQLTWQAAIAQATMNAQSTSAGLWSQDTYPKPAVDARRNSVQSTISQTMEPDRPALSNHHALHSSSDPRRGSLNSYKSNITFAGATKRKGKHSDDTLQRTINTIQPRSFNARIDSPVSDAAHRQSVEQLQQHPPLPQRNIKDDKSTRSSTTSSAQTMIPTHTQRTHKRP